MLCRCDEAGDTSLLGNNETKPPKQIGLNSVTKNRTLIYPSQPNPIKQRTAADAAWLVDLLGTKKKTAPMLLFKLNFNWPPRCC